MKKLMMLLAVALVAFASNAASFKWSATYIYSPTDSEALYNGTAKLFCDALGTDALSSASVADGKIAATTFSSDSFVAGQKYDFYFTIEDGEYSYTSNIKAQTANATTTPTIGFGSQQTSTQGGGWQGGSSDTPEPTSGMLLLFGLAGLALRRKQA